MHPVEEIVASREAEKVWGGGVLSVLRGAAQEGAGDQLTGESLDVSDTRFLAPHQKGGKISVLGGTALPPPPDWGQWGPPRPS